MAVISLDLPARVSLSRTRRHPADAVRLALALGGVAMTTMLARRAEPTVFEVNAFRLVNDLPVAIGAPLLGVMQLGALVAVPAVAATALLGGRARLARLVLLGGSLSWLVTKALQSIVDQEPPEHVLPGVSLHGVTNPGFSFPATHVAVAAALATVAGPYLSRPNRRLAWWVVAVIGIARVYVGAHFPVDALGGAAVGWGIGSLVHLCLGAPRGSPAASTVESALLARGHRVRSVDTRRASPGTAIFVVALDDGTDLVAKVLGRDQPEADWLYRAWRMLAFREIGAGSGGDPGRRVEHEAYILLLAQRAGLHVPAVVSTERLGDGEALLLTSRVAGRPLADLDPAELNDEVLRNIWAEVERAHAARLLLRPAGLNDFVIDADDRAWLVDLGRGGVSAGRDELARDLAELLAVLATGVGPARAISSGKRALSANRLEEALPYLQPLELSAELRGTIAKHDGVLDGLRRGTAMAAGIEPTPMEAPVRIAARNLLPLAGALFAVNLVLAQVGQAQATWDALRRASWPWLLLTAAISGLTYLMSAVALIGATGRRLAVGRTWLVQVAAAFTNRLAPAGLGGMRSNVRYLESTGSTRPAAVASVGLNSVAGLVVHVVGIALVVPLLGAGRTRVPLSRPDLPDYWPALIGVVAGMGIVGVAHWRVQLRGRARASACDAWAGLVSVFRRPAGAARLFGGSAGVTMGYALALVAACRSVSISLPVTTVVAVYLGGAAVAAAAPTPGGLGALEAALVAGLTTAGAATGPAVAAVLAYRLVTYWLPTLPGLVAFRHLRRRRLL